MGKGTHSCFGCGQNFVVDIDPRTGKWWGITGLCKHLRPQLRKDYDGVVCLRYYRANGLYNTNKRTPLLYGNISKHSKRPGNGDGEAPARRQGQVEVEDAAAASPSAINVIVG